MHAHLKKNIILVYTLYEFKLSYYNSNQNRNQKNQIIFNAFCLLILCVFLIF